MLPGCRKFCDNHFSLARKLLPQSIVDVLADGFDIAVKQDRQLSAIQPNLLLRRINANRQRNLAVSRFKQDDVIVHSPSPP